MIRFIVPRFGDWGRGTLRRLDEPIRAELFSAERLEKHAESLAAAQKVAAVPGAGRSLVTRVGENGRVLLDAYRAISGDVREERAITPAAAWLVDNFHLVEEQIREIRADLPKGFYRQLPKLIDGPLEGTPRVFGIAWAFVAHTDSLFDPQSLARFVHAYQRVQPLTIGELWAVAITLRIVLVENLRRTTEFIVSGRHARAEANAFADRLLGATGADAEAAQARLRSLDGARLRTAFAVQLVQRLRDQDPAVTPALAWLESRLASQGTTADEIVQEEHRRQGAMNVTVRNVITSMRLISAVDWAEFFESVSLVDEALRAGSDFAEMDFPSRDDYRHAIEELARCSRHSELEVARRAIAAAKGGGNAESSGSDITETLRRRDPGYYLIANGKRAFELELGARIPLRQRLTRAVRAAGILGYLGAIVLLSGLFLALPLWIASTQGVGVPIVVALALVALIPASDLAVALVNRFVTSQIGPRRLPGLELREGVPSSLRTLVAVPTLLTTHAALVEQIQRLEVHYLANPNDDLRFALLSDWVDCATQSAPGDEERVQEAVEGIERLNRRYGPTSDGERFLLLHRRRVWNDGERKWMGWERKRGKLHELNRWLRGATDTTFLAPRGRFPEAPSGIRYVITLDADTRLPRGVARRLVGTMAHALNRPRFDPASGRVVAGHAVLQPRVTPMLPVDREGSPFHRVFSGPGGIDPYAAAVSDVYQDLFDEGSYTGKGIYDVDVFEQALEGRVPESTLLSHDLFEGIFARAGLVTDVGVAEDFPERYDVAAARQHRWARGDWQLLPWILGRGPGSRGRGRRGAIPLVGRWKMIDNLRRTLAPLATLLALVVGWTLPGPAAAAWTMFVLSTLVVPAFLPLLAGLVPRRPGVSIRIHVRTVVAELALTLLQVFFSVALLAHQAWLMADAIVRTLFRMLLRRRRLLEWITAAQAQFSARLDRTGFYRRMAGGVALGIAVAVAVLYEGHGLESWMLASPFLALWSVSPIVAWWASRSHAAPKSARMSTDDALALRRDARRTWRFFETFITDKDGGLPPDNFQEEPAAAVAHRTSPTNLGLYLLSVVAARDFGWLGTTDAVDRLDATLETMKRLEHFRGHLYNWYDTRDCRPLEPKYVSSVDSGNLAGHLIALGGACREMLGQPAVHPAWLDGIRDAVELARDAIAALSRDHRTHSVTRQQLVDALDALELSCSSPPQSFAALLALLAELGPRADTVADIAATLRAEWSDGSADDVQFWAEAVRRCVRSHERDVASWTAAASGTMPAKLRNRLEAIHEFTEQRVAATEFGFLFDPKRQLFSIGYRVSEGTLDPSYYDLLASEARLASFIAIAKGDVPARHWFRLGRALTPVDRGSALISWSGSMFEYLMPSLVMREPSESLLGQSGRLVVRRQIEYGTELGIPWGVSESGYNLRDREFTYQYSNFGVPGLGLKWGLSEDAVVAPYATALAAMVDPKAATANLARLAAEGGRGRYGHYEALDYTPSRLPEGEKVAVIRAYMAHHQGMTLVAIANALHDGAMRARFHSAPIVLATELLLQERTPRDVVVARPRAEEVTAAANVREMAPPMLRRFHSPHNITPRTHLLSNGRYAVMMTGAGSGYSHWRDIAVTRWHEDTTCDPWGSFIFLRDARTGDVWSAGYQPSGVEPDSYGVSFAEGRAEFVRHDGSISTTLEVVVSPESDAEVRRVSLSNLGTRVREIEVTSYAEIVLAPARADAAHPAFSKMFVTTEYVASVGALVATRRARSPDEPPIWAAHLAVTEGASVGEAQFETDRARFIGRGREIRAPISVTDGRPLSNTVGAVLDPVFSIRRRLRIQPGETARVAFWTLVAPSRAEAIDLADKHQESAAFERAVTLAWTQAQVQLHHLGVDADEAHLFQRLANRVLYCDPTLRPPSDVLKRIEWNPTMLWAQGISGDLPIVLVRIDEAEDLDLVRQLLRAHEYWRMKQLAVDLVILNERSTSYVQDLQISVEASVRASQSRPPVAGEIARGSVFLLRADLVSQESRSALQAAARAVLRGRRGSLAEHVRRLHEPEPAPPPRPKRSTTRKATKASRPRSDTEFFNGLGGFAKDGREYVTVLGEGQWTPAPWINVVASPTFGFQVSTEGSGYTWSVNSRENQLTSWSNDPVRDAPGEAIYVRDESSGEIWGPTALPIRMDDATYVASHGRGYSRFEHVSHEIALELLQFVPIDDPIKISRLKIRNRSSRFRRLSVTAYVEWVLGTSRGASAPFVVTELDTDTGALLARNPANHEFGRRVAFADLAGKQDAWTCDRTEFLGRNGTLDQPAALAVFARLSGRVGAGLDPCGALQTLVELAPNAETEVVFFLGAAATKAESVALIRRYRAADLDAALKSVSEYWNGVLDTVQVKTPDRSMDVLLNGWLLYQTLACRVWARSAFYQASGAYGFRDQLQDVMALVVSRPDLAREHLLRAGSQQFIEGDVLHWWLPTTGQGVRTRISDDLLWLPYAAAHYVDVTGDTGILDATIPFLEGPRLRAGEIESFLPPMAADERATLFEHCARALDRSLSVGAHGIPLFGTGDWNDGMNRVGHHGKGESVWLGWFLHAALALFAPWAERRGELARAKAWRTHADSLRESLERTAWDGDWYRRGFFDDGSALGSAMDAECRIDSIAQTWAVMSGAGDPDRARRAMAAVDAHLVRRDDGLILLFTPPFDRSPLDPGYIKGYPPGTRENGGQYTHAASWAVIAFAMLGEGDKAAELFSILNPIRRASTRAAIHRYRVEPYVMCADVYAMPPHVGRGGWTWYTGSAAWMYRAALEWILGFRVRGTTLFLDPCIPKDWPGFEIAYAHRTARYEIQIENPQRVQREVLTVELDGHAITEMPARIPLLDDGATHRVRVVLGSPQRLESRISNDAGGPNTA